MLIDAIDQALRQMGRNPVRTFLTSLGVLIGVAAVITMVSVGQGATASVERDMSTFGGNLLFVVPGSSEGFGARPAPADPLVEADAQALKAEVPGLEAVAPSGMSIAVATYGDARYRTEVRGSTNDWLRAINFKVLEGRAFEAAELDGGQAVCILGTTVREKLFGAQPPVGATLRLGETSCRVVGVLDSKGENTFGADQDDFVLIPLRMLQRRFLGKQDVGIVFLLARDDVPTARLRADIEDVMDRRRHIAPGADRNYTVRDMAEMMTMLNRISTVLTSFLAAIAGVSLLVGGIGIMNIMLVSVTERTREIGIRLAIGARARDVLLQFIVEAVVLSAVGGIAGVMLAALLSWAIATALDVPLILRPEIIALAVGVSALVGIVFGWWPAHRAAKLKPIDALRHE